MYFRPASVVLLLAGSLAAAEPVSDDFSADPFAGNAELVGETWRGGGPNKDKAIQYDAERQEVRFLHGLVHLVRTDVALEVGHSAVATVRLDRENNFSKIALFLTTDPRDNGPLHEQRDVVYAALSNTGGVDASHGSLVGAMRAGGAAVALRNFATGVDLLNDAVYTITITRRGASFVLSVDHDEKNLGKLTLGAADLSRAKLYVGVGTFGNVRAALTAFQIVADGSR